MRPHDRDDQAAGLRRLVGDLNHLRALGILGPDAELNSIAGANLAFALGHRGDAVCLIDEAPGPHNVATRFGLTPNYGLVDVLDGKRGFSETLAEAPGGLQLLHAPNGSARVAGTDERAWNRLADEFIGHEWEWLLLAAPADESPSLALASPLRLLVLPAAQSRLPEAYAVLKAAHRKQPDTRWLALVMNAGEDDKTHQLMSALNETTQRFLGIEVEPVGAVPKDAHLDQATRAMRAVLEFAPGAPSAQSIRLLAERLHDVAAPAMRQDAKTFWQRMGLIGRLNPQPRSRTQHVQHSRAYG